MGVFKSAVQQSTATPEPKGVFGRAAVQQKEASGEDNNIIQKGIVNLIGRPAIRLAQTAVALPVRAFGGQKTNERLDEELAKPVELPFGAGTVPAQKRFTDDKGGAAKQIALESGKSALDIATLGAGSAVNTGLKGVFSRAGLPILEKLGGTKLGAWIAKQLPAVAANVTEGLGYNTASNVLNEKKPTENAGLASVLSAVIPPAVTGFAKGASLLKNEITNAPAIMQRVARISKGKQQKFEQTAGQSVGDYLTTRGIFGTPKELTEKLIDRFQKSKATADESLATLKGTFQPTPVKTMLNDALEREMRISSEGAPSADLSRVQFLNNKYKTQGLDMTEINEAKRIFERNNKMDFLKANVPEGVARANAIDSAVRSWQFQKADELGLKNLGEINKETRLAKQLADDIGAEYSGQAGNNAISITDWILLSGGDPTAVAAFLAKKTGGSKRLQSGLAELLTPKSKINSNIVADLNPTELPLELPAGAIQMPPRYSPDANQLKVIQGQNVVPERLALPAPQEQPIQLPGEGILRGQEAIRTKPAAVSAEQKLLETSNKSTTNIPLNKGSIKMSALLGGSAGVGGGAAVTSIFGKKKLNDSPVYTPLPKKGDSPKANAPKVTPPKKLVSAIGNNETNVVDKPYSFKQPSGSKNLGDALGKYQVTSAELANKSTKWLGRKVTDKEFLNSPTLQDKYMEAKVAWLQSKGLTDAQILAAHRGGYSDFGKINDTIKKYQPYVDKGLQFIEANNA